MLFMHLLVLTSGILFTPNANDSNLTEICVLGRGGSFRKQFVCALGFLVILMYGHVYIGFECGFQLDW